MYTGIRAKTTVIHHLLLSTINNDHVQQTASMVMMRLGPNDARHVVWAIGKFFKTCIYAYTYSHHPLPTPYYLTSQGTNDNKLNAFDSTKMTMTATAATTAANDEILGSRCVCVSSLWFLFSFS